MRNTTIPQHLILFQMLPDLKYDCKNAIIKQLKTYWCNCRSFNWRCKNYHRTCPSATNCIVKSSCVKSVIELQRNSQS
uniref:Uncharacterized protein n=1 Tax=Meloidogyne javanica TaxID=6303 RepID=A0A915LUU0_MELJA